MATTTWDWVLHHRWEAGLPLHLSVTSTGQYGDPTKTVNLHFSPHSSSGASSTAAGLTDMRRLRPHTWSPWSGRSSFLCTASEHFSALLVSIWCRASWEGVLKTNKHKKKPQKVGCCSPNRLLLCSQENGCSLQRLHLHRCRGNHAGQQTRPILWNDHRRADPVRLLGWWDSVVCDDDDDGDDAVWWCLSDWTDVIGRRSGTGHPPDLSDGDLTHKY